MQFAKPVENVLQLGLKEGMKVGDFGAGSGHYTFAISNIVGSSGKVYAIDVQEDVLLRLRSDASQKGLRNIDTIWGNLEKSGGTGLKDGALDAAVLSNTLFQLDDKGTAVREIKRVLKQGGKLLLIDWAGAYSGVGPAKEHVVSERDAEEFFINGGFHKVKSFRAGPHHYSIIFTAP
jgi:ubiquinone/menaquinone biosynthesis C-methylase UbiE